MIPWMKEQSVWKLSRPELLSLLESSRNPYWEGEHFSQIRGPEAGGDIIRLLSGRVMNHQVSQSQLGLQWQCWWAKDALTQGERPEVRMSLATGQALSPSNLRTVMKQPQDKGKEFAKWGRQRIRSSNSQNWPTGQRCAWEPSVQSGLCCSRLHMFASVDKFALFQRLICSLKGLGA